MRRVAAQPSWDHQLATARRSVRSAAQAIRADFGHRRIVQYRGAFDVQLHADLVARDVMAKHLLASYPGYGLITEEDANRELGDSDAVWIVDPLDGTNNFGYGIAHCAISVALFAVDRLVLALTYDPILHREFFAIENRPPSGPLPSNVPLEKATISIVTNYSENGRITVRELDAELGPHSKRLVSLWAPALDLALISSGALDAMVCVDGSIVDVCGGMFLVEAAGGSVVDLSGNSLCVDRSLYDRPISFVAAGSQKLADELLDRLGRASTPL